MRFTHLSHLADDHGWRWFWLFGMSAAEAEQTHHRQYPECDWKIDDQAR